MAASKPTSWLSKQHNILSLLAFTWGPYSMVWVVSLSATKLIPRSLTPVQHISGIRSLSGFGTVVTALALSEPYLRYTIITRLFLKTFRGVRAITEFDWPFTPNHNSSEQFSTRTRSDLHVVLPTLHPGHG